MIPLDAYEDQDEDEEEGQEEGLEEASAELARLQEELKVKEELIERLQKARNRRWSLR